MRMLGLVVVAGCANASTNTNNDPTIDAMTSTSPHDAPTHSVPIDSAPPLDASVMVDAGQVTSPDAALPPDAGGSSLFCQVNSQCTNAGECCLTLGGSDGFCVAGTVVFGTCVPAT